MSPRPPAQRVEVCYEVNGTTKNVTYTAAGSSVTMFEDGGASVDLIDGRDLGGRQVLTAQFSRCFVVVRYIISPEEAG